MFRRADRQRLGDLFDAVGEPWRLAHRMGELAVDPYQRALAMPFDGGQIRLHQHVPCSDQTRAQRISLCPSRRGASTGPQPMGLEGRRADRGLQHQILPSTLGGDRRQPAGFAPRQQHRGRHRHAACRESEQIAFVQIAEQHRRWVPQRRGRSRDTDPSLEVVDGMQIIPGRAQQRRHRLPPVRAAATPTGHHGIDTRGTQGLEQEVLVLIGLRQRSTSRDAQRGSRTHDRLKSPRGDPAAR